MTKEQLVKWMRKNADDCPCQFSCEKCDEDDCFTPVFRAAADLIEQQAAKIKELKAKVPRWIPVTERLPKLEETVLVLDRRGNKMVRTLRRLDSEEEPSFRPDGLVPQKHITHWMPLPEAAKEGKNENLHGR